MVTTSRLILVPVDSSEPAARGFDHALALGRRYGAELHVVHAVPAHEPLRRRARERRALIGRLRRQAADAQVRLTVTVRHGDAADVIRMHAQVLSPNLIVVGTHQRTGIERLRAGSVAERVMLEAAQPVLIVPDRAHAVEPGAFERIAVAVDFGPASQRGVVLALGLAGRDNGHVTAVHAVPRVGWHRSPVYTRDEDLGQYLDRLSQEELTQDAWRRLERAIPRHVQEKTGLEVRVVEGSPAAAITDVAGDMQADMIVVGVPRRGAVARTLFGATAARLLRLASVPVLAVPDITADTIVDSGWVTREVRPSLFADPRRAAAGGWDGNWDDDWDNDWTNDGRDAVPEAPWFGDEHDRPARVVVH